MYFSYLSDSHTQALWSPRPVLTLRCSTAEWRINTNPISCRLRAQIGWDQTHRDRSDRAWGPGAEKKCAWQESWNRSVPITGKIYKKLYYWRCGWIWKTWCRDVLPPVTDASRLRLSGQHCRLIADSHLEDGDLRKMLASPLYMQSREDCESSRIPIASGKLAAKFSLRSEEPGNQLKSSVFKNADPSNLGRSRLEGNKDHWLSHARSELMKQEHQVESLNNCISELQQQTYAQRLELQVAQHGFIESRRDQVRLQEESSKKGKVIRDTQIRSMHEMGEMKRVQELRVDDVCAKIKRKSWVNTKAHFSVAGNAGTDEF